MKLLSKLIIILSCIVLTACNSSSGSNTPVSGNNNGGNQPTPTPPTPSISIPFTSLTPAIPITYQYTLLYSFAGGSDGSTPKAGLIQGSDGNFYGTTTMGGLGGSSGCGSGCGTIFKVTSQGVERVVYSFAGGNDGSTPKAELIQGSDGNFYGTTQVGGNGDSGTVFKVTPATPTYQKTTLYSFAGTDGNQPVAGLIQASDGNFYGTTTSGGTSYGIIFKITPQEIKTTLYNFTGGTDGASPQAGLIQGSDGNFYGTTYGGGIGNNGTVFKVTPAGVKTVLYSFAGDTDGKQPVAGLIQASDGNFYGTTQSGGSGGSSGSGDNGTIFKVTPQGQETVVFSFVNEYNDGAEPNSIIQASDGNFYGTTKSGGSGNSCGSSGCGTIFKITSQGQETVLYNFGGGADGATPQAGLIQASDGNFYGTTTIGGDGNGTVFKIIINQ